jgi:hypothetical protein
MNGSELLHEAGTLVAAGWCQGDEATTDDGEPSDVQAASATHWSLLGALQAAAFSDETTRIEDVAMAVGAIAELISDPSLANWNDQPGRTSSDVELLLEHAEAIALEELDDAGLTRPSVKLEEPSHGPRSLTPFALVLGSFSSRQRRGRPWRIGAEKHFGVGAPSSCSTR